MALVPKADFGQCRLMTATPHSPLVIAGQGNTARMTALSLAAAGLPVCLEPMRDEAPDETPKMPDWQSVLALSPTAKAMLEVSQIWPHMDCPHTPILDMQVYGSAADMTQTALLPAQLGFGAQEGTARHAPQGETDAPIVTPLGYVVSLAALTRALQRQCAAAVKEGHITVLPATIDDFDAAAAIVHLADGSCQKLSLLIDSYRAAPVWRRRAAARPLSHDYHAAALVGTLALTRPHGHMARQIFLPDGPLALLPLPQADRAALVWSLPRRTAQALSRVDADILAHELHQATHGHIGRLRPDGAMGVHHLELSLAQDMVAPHYVALGDAAHVVHPLAGQGFNLSLRDAALLADTLFEARALGLPPHDAVLLDRFHRARRADAGLTGATTHTLARLFESPLAPLGRLGMGLLGRAMARRDVLRAMMVRQANGGLSADNLPRLMRGQEF